MNFGLFCAEEGAYIKNKSQTRPPALVFAGFGKHTQSTGSPCRHSYARAPRRALVVPKLAWVLHRAAPLVCIGWREKPGRCWHRVTCVGLSGSLCRHPETPRDTQRHLETPVATKASKRKHKETLAIRKALARMAFVGWAHVSTGETSITG